METKEIYLDNNATTRPLPEIIKSMLPVLSNAFGNPSSSHSAGERTRKYINEARKQIGDLIGAHPENIVFTSSGTEANNMAFYTCTKNRDKTCRILTTPVEHSSIRKMCNFLSINGVEVVNFSIDSKGHLDIDQISNLTKEDFDLVSIQWVNNETGVIQPIEEIVKICHDNGKLFHTDAAQAVGKMDLNLKEIPVDFLALTGHKFHSPQGIGALYCSDRFILTPIFFGGFQEEGFRPGTENVSGIVGMGKAAEIRREKLNDYINKMRELRDYFESSILDSIPNTSVNGDPLNRVCNTTNIMFGGIDGRVLLKQLDQEGIRCSQTSACINSQPDPSFVLKAMGLSDEEAYSSVRFSFSIENTMNEVDQAIKTIIKACERLRYVTHQFNLFSISLSLYLVSFIT
ncbi:MAG: cysteine desulfurase family protein [Thermodesulfobacteriota bacterium]